MEMPAGKSTAPVVTMMNQATMQAAIVPETASTRWENRSLVVRPFSTTLLWVKNIIQGAMVVPIMAMTRAMKLGLAWALGMAVGVLFVFLSPGYVPELNAFLFGNLLTITSSDLWAFAIYTAVLLIFFGFNFRYIVACAFDRDFAQVSGLPVRFINYTMTALVAVCIVLTIRLVGIMLLMAMLTLPQMVAETFCRRFGRMAAVSVAVSMITGIGGLALAAVIDVPCAAIIVLLQVAVYAVAAASRHISASRPARQ